VKTLHEQLTGGVHGEAVLAATKGFAGRRRPAMPPAFIRPARIEGTDLGSIAT
jgi:hypothetical protein